MVWTTERAVSFEVIKAALASQPIIRMPEFNKEYILRTDASKKGIGAVLMQEYDGVLHPVSYASRQLMPHGTRYSAVERECLALVWAVEKFHIYIYGTPFLIQTDHQPLSYLSQAKHLNSRVLRWSFVLQEYSFRVERIKGSENAGADFLSRLQK